MGATSSAAAAADNHGYTIETEVDGFRLAKRTLPIPAPGAGQVRVRIEAASLNYRDLLVARSKKENITPLSDGAGVVDAVGEGVSHVKPGDRVMPSFFQNWPEGRFEAAYHASARGSADVGGMLTRYVLSPENVLVAIPAAMSFEQASTLPCAGVTAWTALFDRGRLAAGDTVLVQGTGGVALFGLQLANAAGAKVIVTSSSDDKLARARELGAWQTINYTTHPEWDVEAVRMTDGVGVTHILETGGKGTFERSLKAVSAAGHIAQIGGLAGFGPELNLMRLQLINGTIDGINVGPASNLAALATFMDKHRIAPVIDRVFAFDDAGVAYDELASGRHFGKLVIRL